MHLTTPCLGEAPVDVLMPIIDAMIPSSSNDASSDGSPSTAASASSAARPNVLFKAIWTHLGEVVESAPSIANISLCQRPSSVVGFAEAIQGARRLYSRLYPGENLFGLSSADAAFGDDSDEEAVGALEAALAGLPDA